MGLCSFFQRTIPKFAEIAAPLSRLTRKDANLQELTEEPAKNAFKSLKKALCARPCLTPVDFKKEFILTVDSSKGGAGAILSQKSLGIEHPCAYASRVFGKTEENYPPLRLEAAGVLWACRHFRPYMVGKEFVLRTDHKPLTSLNRIDGQTLERFRAEMEDFLPYRVEYLPGEKMPADGLSRPPQLAAITQNILSSPFNWENIHYLQQNDIFCKACVCILRFKRWPKSQHLLNLAKQIDPGLKLVHGLLCHKFGNTPWAPEAIRKELCRLSHDNPLASHFGKDKTVARLRKSWWWPELDQDVELFRMYYLSAIQSSP